MFAMVVQESFYLYGKTAHSYYTQSITELVSSNALFILMCFLVIAALSRAIQVERNRVNILPPLEEVKEYGKTSKANVVGLLTKVKHMQKISIGWAWLVVVVVAAIFSWYWFSVRPAQIQKECFEYPYPSYDECLVGNGLAI